jgi:hypothetical protein
MSSSNSLFKTRISAHLLDAFVSEGEKVTVEGWLTFYDEKEMTWKPLDGLLTFYLNGREIGKAKAQYGLFSFTFPSPSVGKHKIEIKFKEEGYESSYKSLFFEVVEKRKKERVSRVARLIFFLILFLCFILFLSIFLSKLFLRS